MLLFSGLSFDIFTFCIFQGFLVSSIFHFTPHAARSLRRHHTGPFVLGGLPSQVGFLYPILVHTLFLIIIILILFLLYWYYFDEIDIIIIDIAEFIFLHYSLSSKIPTLVNHYGLKNQTKKVLLPIRVLVYQSASWSKCGNQSFSQDLKRISQL